MKLKIIMLMILMIISINNVSAFTDNFNDDDISDWTTVGSWSLLTPDNFTGNDDDYYPRGYASAGSSYEHFSQLYKEIGLHDVYQFDIKGYAWGPSLYYLNNYNKHFYYWDYENNIGISTQQTGSGSGRDILGIGFSMTPVSIITNEWYRIFVQQYDNGIRIRVYDNDLNEISDEICDYTPPILTTGTFYVDITATHHSGTGYSYGYIDNIITSSHDYSPEPPTLTTDKTYYNTSEIIEISFTNIDTIYNECIENKCSKPYNLHILYPVTDAYKDYKTKYIYPLTYNLEDENIYLNTSFLSPQNNYILGIVGINGDYTQHEDILIFSNDFVVYPDDEYLSVSCDSESECYTYNNADITIYYSILNNSNIIIKDNDNNIINTYYNIIGNGSILYYIPDDLYHVNTYPNWKVYLNNTEYSTSFNKGVTVYWSQFTTPTPTPTFTPQPTPDINISDTVDEFKTEMEPIKQLLFGLTEIVIDNPDYNKDNTVDESEINHWFNSLIPGCILLLLVIMCIGLRKKRK